MYEVGEREGSRRSGQGPSGVIALVFVAFVVVQTAVPAMQLFAPRPAMFGWHMYSAITGSGIYLVERGGMAADTVEIDTFVMLRRAEIDWTTVLPPHLCSTISGATAIVHQPPDPQLPAQRTNCQ